jgi:hypothetical protein
MGGETVGDVRFRIQIMQMIAVMMLQMRPGYGDKTPERSEMRWKTRLHSKVASEFLGEWQGEPYGLKNGRVRAYQEWRQDTGEERDKTEDETAL